MKAPACCLVAEDDVVIGMAVQEQIEGLGSEVAGPFASCAEALAWIQDHTPDLGVLDYDLCDGLSTQVAARLIDRGVPVIVLSGYSQDEAPTLQGATWLEKPFAAADLEEAVLRASSLEKAEDQCTAT